MSGGGGDKAVEVDEGGVRRRNEGVEENAHVGATVPARSRDMMGGGGLELRVTERL